MKIGTAIANLIICLILWVTVETRLKASSEKTLQLPAGSFWITYSPTQLPAILKKPPEHWRSIHTHSLLLSGSAVPNLGNMMWIKNKLGQQYPISILDLRQETHVYIDGLPVSIFYGHDEINWGKSKATIYQEERAWIKYFNKKRSIKITKTAQSPLGIKLPIASEILHFRKSYSEQHAAQKAGLGYFRLEVPDYHPPSPAQVDRFLAILKQLPNHAWLHIHCAAGKGRTTTFMAMRDILANAENDSLMDILHRQKNLGGIDLTDDSPTLLSKSWKKEYHQARRYFIKLFYQYVHSGAYLKDTFSSWVLKQPASSYSTLLKTKAYNESELY